MTTNDEHGAARVILTPGSEARSDEFGRGGVDQFLALADLRAQSCFGLSQRQAAKAGVDEVADLAQRVRRGAAVERDDTILDASIGPDQYRKRTRWAELHEVQLPQP